MFWGPRAEVALEPEILSPGVEGVRVRVPNPGTLGLGASGPRFKGVDSQVPDAGVRKIL